MLKTKSPPAYILSLAVTALLCVITLVGLSAVTASAADGNLCQNYGCTGTFQNGFCPECGNYETPEIDEDGYCLIDNAGKLYEWALCYNQVQTPLYRKSARLTADIVVNQNVIVNGALNPDPAVVAGFRPWTAHYISGGTVFDGQGHTISGLYTEATPSTGSLGLFSTVDNQCTVRNLGVVDSYFSTNRVNSQRYAGAIAASINGTVSNCYSNAILIVHGYSMDSAATATVGGIVGEIDSLNAVVENCYFTGRITVSAQADGTEPGAVARVSAGGIVGRNDGIVRNCYNTGTVESLGATAEGTSKEYEYVGAAVGENNGGTVENCYYLAASETDTIDGTSFITQEALASGQLTYRLNERVTDGTQSFYQTVGEGTPAFAGKTVYEVLWCDGATTTYINTPAIEAHDPTITDQAYFNEDGTCRACGHTAAVKVVTVDMIIGSTVMYKTNYYSVISHAFQGDTSAGNPAQMTLLRDAVSQESITLDDFYAVLDTQGFRVENFDPTHGLFTLKNGSSLTLNGAGTLYGKAYTALLESGSTLTLNDSVALTASLSLPDYGVVNVGEASTFSMTGGSIEGTEAIRYSNPTAVVIQGGRIIGDFHDTTGLINATHPVIVGATFPEGLTLTNAHASVTLGNLLGSNVLFCQADGTVASGQTKALTGAVTVKTMEDVLNDIRDAVQNGENGADGKDGKTPTFKVESGELKVSYDEGKTWTSLGGVQGADGKDGKDGQNGQDGVDGKDGKDGQNGQDGVDGKDGAPGEKGAQGEDGVDGANGKDGLDGGSGSVGLTVAAMVIACLSLIGNIALVVLFLLKKKN